MSSFERWSLIAAFAGIVINVVVFGALAWQLRLVADQVRQGRQATDRDHERRRKQATLEFYAATFGQQAELRRMMPNSFDTEAIADVIEKAVSGDESTRKQLATFLSLHEHMAAGIRADVFDISVLDMAAGTRFIAVAANYRKWIEHRRRELDDPTLYAELEYLARELVNSQKRFESVAALGLG